MGRTKIYIATEERQIEREALKLLAVIEWFMSQHEGSVKDYKVIELQQRLGSKVRTAGGDRVVEQDRILKAIGAI